MKKSLFTKEKIKKTLEDMLEEMPLKKITVSSLAKASGVSKGTFYKYYDDIPSLIEGLLKEQMEMIIKSYEANPSYDLVMKKLFEYALSKKKIISNICDSVNRSIFECYLWKVVYHSSSMIIKRGAGGRSISESNIEKLIDHYACTILGKTLRWIDNGMKVDINSMEANRDYLNKMHLSVTEELFDLAESLDSET